MRAAAALVAAPSPVSLAELRSRQVAWEAKVQDLKAEQMELSLSAEDGDEEAQRKLAALKADFDQAEDRLERVRTAREAAERRQDKAAAAAAKQARAIRANAFEARIQAIVDSGEPLRAELYDIAARLRAVTPAAQALVNDAGLPLVIAENILLQLRSDVAFAFGPFLAIPRPEAKPISPFSRFADGTRADLARAGLAPSTHAPAEESTDNG